MQAWPWLRKRKEPQMASLNFRHRDFTHPDTNFLGDPFCNPTQVTKATCERRERNAGTKDRPFFQAFCHVEKQYKYTLCISSHPRALLDSHGFCNVNGTPKLALADSDERTRTQDGNLGAHEASEGVEDVPKDAASNHHNEDGLQGDSGSEHPVVPLLQFNRPYLNSSFAIRLQKTRKCFFSHPASEGFRLAPGRRV